MSKVKIEGHASGTGTLNIAAPNTNTDRTLTLPDGAGEILTNATSLPAANLTGTLPAIDGSALTGLSAGVDEVHYWYKNSDFSNTTTQTKISGWSQFSANSANSNTMSESSGDWTFPTTGVWLVKLHVSLTFSGSLNCYTQCSIHTSDGTERTYGFGTTVNSTTELTSSATAQYVHNVSNTSTDTLSFQTVTSIGTSVGIGGSFRPRTNVVFIKLRD